MKSLGYDWRLLIVVVNIRRERGDTEGAGGRVPCRDLVRTIFYTFLVDGQVS